MSVLILTSQTYFSDLKKKDMNQPCPGGGLCKAKH